MILKINKGICYLGIYITANCTMVPMEQHLWSKATFYLSAFHHTPMTRREETVLYQLCFLPALTYSLPATWLHDKFFEKIHCLSTNMLLNKMGFHRNLPCSLVFAPCHVGGVGFCHLCLEMEVQQVMILLQHMWAKTPLGQTVELLTCQYQLWARFQHQILVNTTPCPWVPDKWLSCMQCTMLAYNIKIHHNAWTTPRYENMMY